MTLAPAIRRLGLFAPALFGALALTGAANAGDSTQGSDLSYVTGPNRYVYACDNESDGHGVHADWLNTSNFAGRIDDPDGYGGQCGVSSYQNIYVSFHVVIEEVNNQPDYRGNESYH